MLPDPLYCRHCHPHRPLCRSTPLSLLEIHKSTQNLQEDLIIMKKLIFGHRYLLIYYRISDERIFITWASQIMKHNEKKITFSDIVKLNVTKGHTCVIHANTCVRGGRHVMHVWTHIKTARSIRLYCVKIPVFGCLAAWSASRWHVAWEPVLASWDLHYPLDLTLCMVPQESPTWWSIQQF